MYEDSIEFSLSSADKEVVGFILAQELAILTNFYSHILTICANVLTKCPHHHPL